MGLRRPYDEHKSLIEKDKSSGAQGRNRTTDTVIFSHVLYQLSYLGTSAAAEVKRAYRGGRAQLSSPR